MEANKTKHSLTCISQNRRLFYGVFKVLPSEGQIKLSSSPIITRFNWSHVSQGGPKTCVTPCALSLHLPSARQGLLAYPGQVGRLLPMPHFLQAQVSLWPHFLFTECFSETHLWPHIPFLRIPQRSFRFLVLLTETLSFVCRDLRVSPPCICRVRIGNAKV